MTKYKSSTATKQSINMKKNASYLIINVNAKYIVDIYEAKEPDLKN